ncbi:Uncharacterized protein SCF082_LOCUS12382 [Durusdinium trenchii]|uniref:Uncharacterized protein n=1 Tax=Durusdinium trenchii TaxID=1381693 RepID=A0ABP0JJY4_9DINO
MVKVRVKVHRPRVEELDMDYPFIGLESWCEYILEHCSHHLLGGFEIGKDAAQYTAMFHRFWERYKQLDPSHIAFSTFSDFGRVIPYCVHGDEGRGKAKSAILITSYQALISPHGEGATNLKGHSYTTRLLAYLMPSKNFASNDATIDCLSAHMVRGETFYLAYIGLKGDWPLRTDLAHTWAIGVGKEFCGSAILTIIDLGLMDDAGSLTICANIYLALQQLEGENLGVTCSICFVYLTLVVYVAWKALEASK